MAAIGPTSPDRAAGRRAMPRRHKWLLVLAFEILVLGFAQAGSQAARRGILIEISVTPNHVVT